MAGDYLPYTKRVTPEFGPPFYVFRIHEKYYPYRTKWNAVTGTVSPGLLTSYSQDQLKDLYDEAPAISGYV